MNFDPLWGFGTDLFPKIVRWWSLNFLEICDMGESRVLWTDTCWNEGLANCQEGVKRGLFGRTYQYPTFVSPEKKFQDEAIVLTFLSGGWCPASLCKHYLKIRKSMILEGREGWGSLRSEKILGNIYGNQVPYFA